jgi:hypothetical protein
MHSAIRCVVDGQYRVFVSKTTRNALITQDPSTTIPSKSGSFIASRKAGPSPFPTAANRSVPDSMQKFEQGQEFICADYPVM